MWIQFVLKHFALIFFIPAAHSVSFTSGVSEVNPLGTSSSHISEVESQTMTKTGPRVAHSCSNVVTEQPSRPVPDPQTLTTAHPYGQHGLSHSQNMPLEMPNTHHLTYAYHESSEVQPGFSHISGLVQPDVYLLAGWTPTEWTWTPTKWAPSLAPGFKNEIDAVAWGNIMAPQPDAYGYPPQPVGLDDSRASAGNLNYPSLYPDDLAFLATVNNGNFFQTRPNVAQVRSQSSRRKKL